MHGERQYQRIVTNLAIIARLTLCDHCLVLGLIAPELNRLESNGWVNWPDLATFLADLDHAMSGTIYEVRFEVCD